MKRRSRVARVTAGLLPQLAGLCVAAQSSLGAGEPAWLAYNPVNAAMVFPGGIPDTIVELGHNVLEDSAARELALGWRGMLRHEPRVVSGAAAAAKQEVVLGTQSEIEAWGALPEQDKQLVPDAYRLYRTGDVVVVEGGGFVPTTMAWV